MDFRKQEAEELVRRAAEELSLQQRQNEEPGTWESLVSQWKNISADKKAMLFIAVLVAFVLCVVTPILVVSQILSADRADKTLLTNLSGEKRLEVSFLLIDSTGKRMPRQVMKTKDAHLIAKHSGKGWNIVFFGKQWKGLTEELNKMTISCPFSEAVKQAPELKSRQLPPKATLELKVVDSVFQITAEPGGRVQSQGSYLVIRDRFGKSEGTGKAPPPYAIITSRDVRNDSLGSMTSMKYTIPARAGFENFQCVPISK